MTTLPGLHPFLRMDGRFVSEADEQAVERFQGVSLQLGRQPANIAQEAGADQNVPKLEEGWGI